MENVSRYIHTSSVVKTTMKLSLIILLIILCLGGGFSSSEIVEDPCPRTDFVNRGWIIDYRPFCWINGTLNVTISNSTLWNPRVILIDWYLFWPHNQTTNVKCLSELTQEWFQRVIPDLVQNCSNEAWVVPGYSSWAKPNTAPGPRFVATFLNHQFPSSDLEVHAAPFLVLDPGGQEVIPSCLGHHLGVGWRWFVDTQLRLELSEPQSLVRRLWSVCLQPFEPHPKLDELSLAWVIFWILCFCLMILLVLLHFRKQQRSSSLVPREEDPHALELKPLKSTHQ